MELKIALWKINPREAVKYINAYKNNEQVAFNPKIAKRMLDALVVGNNLSPEKSLRIIQEKFKEFENEKVQALVNVLLSDSPKGIIPLIESRLVSKDVSLLCASAYNSLKVAAFMLENKANINVVDSDGWTPLITSLVYGHERMFGFLIGKGADVNARGSKYGTTALMIAALKGDLDKIVLLYNKGADINLRMSDNSTALSMAKRANSLGVVNYLQSIGANE
ncbi:MAG: ankyrin repeat domain-containing protein [Candidatus Margulisbacteria bacterium]|nr:ankyrin repeat domain-containing protein [Candidatus Margulisiibacteriota bacterium]